MSVPADGVADVRPALAGDYYSRSLEERAALLGATGLQKLCKTLIVKNTRHMGARLYAAAATRRSRCPAHTRVAVGSRMCPRPLSRPRYGGAGTSSSKRRVL